MTILFGGGEQNEFGFISGAMNTGVGTFDPNYARCSIRPAAVVQHTFDEDLAAGLAAMVVKEIWYGYRWRGGGGSFNSSADIFVFHGPGGPFFRVRGGGGAANMLADYSIDGGATWNPQAASDIAQSATPVEHTFRIKLDAVAGRLEWWIGETLWWSFTGNTAVMATNIVKTVMGVGNSNGDSYFSEIIVTDAAQPRIGMRLATLVPTSNSAAHTAWSGGFADIDEIVEDASDAISTNTPGDIELFGVTDLPALGPGVQPLALIISGKMQTQNTAPQHVKGALRIAGVDYFSPAAKTVDLVPTNKQFIFENDPSLPPGSLFPSATINAIELGLQALA